MKKILLILPTFLLLTGCITQQDKAHFCEIIHGYSKVALPPDEVNVSNFNSFTLYKSDGSYEVINCLIVTDSGIDWVF